MKKALIILIIAILALAGYLLVTRTTSFHEYRDPALGYRFELARDFGGSLGWLKPSDSDIEKGVITSLGYEDGLFLQIYRPVKGQAVDFADVGKQVYKNGMKHDRSRYYRDGQFSKVGGERAFIFDTQVKFNSKDNDYEYWAADKIFDPLELKNSRPLAPARVAYLTHNGHYFRIIYDPNNRNACRIFSSFKFF